MVVTKMPVINSIIEMVGGKKIFKNTLFVTNQHLLYTSIDLFEALIYLGAEPRNIFILGKIYSINQHVYNYLASKRINMVSNLPQTQYGIFQETFQKDVENLWAQVEANLKFKNIERIIVLDDGGFCLVNMPKHILNKYPVIGVEQTSAGLTKVKQNPLNFPLIEVASSAVKQHIESPMIARSIEEKINSKFKFYDKNLNCGVVGLGAIGRAVTETLLDLGHKVFTYDKDSLKNISIKYAKPVDTMENLLCSAEYIFGCSGQDTLEGINIEKYVKDNKVFVSCSSQDKEFRSLLKRYFPSGNFVGIDPMSTAEFNLGNSVNIKVLQGGFPINLDNSGYAVPANDIQLTRGLLLSGLIQASSLMGKYSVKLLPKNIMLCPLLQQFVIKGWLPFGSDYAKSNSLIKNFSSINWIKKHSGGHPCNNTPAIDLFRKDNDLNILKYSTYWPISNRDSASSSSSSLYI